MSDGRIHPTVVMRGARLACGSRSSVIASRTLLTAALATMAVVGGCASKSATDCAMAQGTVCGDPNWAQWPMPNSVAEVAAGAPHPQSYLPHGDGTVTDQVTRLMWQHPIAPETYTWADAATRCATLSLGGHDDWRLPSVIELVSLVDNDMALPAVSINATAFPDTPTGYYWTSVPVADAPASAWFLFFLGGGTSWDDATNTFNVRCVR